MTRLMLLGLLKQGDLSGYEIKRILEISDAENWSGIQTGSIYYALKKMEEEGLVRQKTTEQTGNRVKTIFSITDKGVEVFQKRLLEKMKHTKTGLPSELYTTLTFVGELEKEEATEAVEMNIKHYEHALKNWKQDRMDKEKGQGTPLSPFMKILFDNGEKHIEADIDYLKKVKSLLKDQVYKIKLSREDTNEEA